jgi:hypothetical protein
MKHSGETYYTFGVFPTLNCTKYGLISRSVYYESVVKLGSELV